MITPKRLRVHWISKRTHSRNYQTIPEILLAAADSLARLAVTSYFSIDNDFVRVWFSASHRALDS